MSKKKQQPIVIPNSGTCDSSVSIEQFQIEAIRAEWKARVDKFCDDLISKGDIYSYDSNGVPECPDLPGFKTSHKKISLIEQRLWEIDILFYFAVLKELETPNVDEGTAVEEVDKKYKMEGKDYSIFRVFKEQYKEGVEYKGGLKSFESLRTKFNHMKNWIGYPAFAKLRQPYKVFSGAPIDWIGESIKKHLL